MALMYSGRNQLVPRSQIHLLPKPVQDGPRHNPLPFDDFICIVEEQLDKAGIVIVEQEYVITANGKRMFGTMHIRLPDYDAEMDPATWNLMLGLRGAHDHRFARGLTIGSQVTVCSNLCFSGDIGTFQTKQTTNIAKRLPPLVNEAVSKIPFHAEQQQAAFGLYEGYSLEKPQGDAILLDLYRQNVLSPSQLGRSVGEWDEPTHDYGANVYTLFNGCTEALKPTGQSFSPELHMQRSQKLTQILDDVVGL